MSLLKLVVFALISLIVTCSTCSADPEDCLCSGYDFSAEEIAQMSSRAMAGDILAAVDLFKYYSQSTGNNEEKFRWLNVAATGGHVVSQYNLGVLYLTDDKRKDPVGARYWLNRAAEGGSELAKKRLLELSK